MSRTGAERIGMVGAFLLAGGLVAALVLYLWPKPPPGPIDKPEQGVSGAKAPPPRLSDPDAAPPPATEGDFQREIERLRDRVSLLTAENEGLLDMLREAGIEVEAVVEEPEAVAAATIEALRRCGPRTAPGEIDDLVARIVAAGTRATEIVKRFLELELDVAFSPNWNYLGGTFVGYPTLRVALIDALSRIGGIDGQTALIRTLEMTERPLEICLIVKDLSKLRDVASVEEAMIEASVRYLDLPPGRGEGIVVDPVLEALSRQEPASASASLLRFARDPSRSSTVAESAFDLLDDLPPDVAIASLTELAADPALGEKGAAAARRLSMRTDAATLEALERVFATAGADARSEVYRTLAVRPKEEAGRVERLDGPEAAADLMRLEEDLAARSALLEARLGTEAEESLRRQLDRARAEFRDLVKRAAAMRKKQGG